MCPVSDELAGVVARLTDDAPLDRRARVGLLGRLAGELTRRGRHFVDVVIEVAPHIPVRDRATLRAQYAAKGGAGAGTDAEVAQALIAAASRTTAAIGAAGGLLSNVELAAPPVIASAPVLVAAETLAVVAVEVKLVAELHELYGRSPAGSGSARAAAYLGAWARRRGIDPFAEGPGLTGVVSGAARRELRQRLLRRAGRNVTTVVPFLAGAVAGAALNRRETHRLGERLLVDLRR